MARVLGRSDFRFAELSARPRSSCAAVRSALDLSALATPPGDAESCRARPLAGPTGGVGSLSPRRIRRPRVARRSSVSFTAGYGVQLWPILQDVHQLHATYGQRAGAFLSNAGVLQVFGVNDHDSARMISDLLGQQAMVIQPMSRALDSEKSGISLSQHHVGHPVLTPDEVRNLPQDLELLFLAGQRPIVAIRFEDQLLILSRHEAQRAQQQRHGEALHDNGEGDDREGRHEDHVAPGQRLIGRIAMLASGGRRIGRKGGSASRFADADAEPPFIERLAETRRSLTQRHARRYDRKATVAGNDPAGRRSRPARYMPEAAKVVAPIDYSHRWGGSSPSHRGEPPSSSRPHARLCGPDAPPPLIRSNCQGLGQKKTVAIMSVGRAFPPSSRHPFPKGLRGLRGNYPP